MNLKDCSTARRQMRGRILYEDSVRHERIAIVSYRMRRGENNGKQNTWKQRA